MKKNKIFIVLGGFFLVLGIVFVIISGIFSAKPKPESQSDPQSSQQIPEYILSAGEEQSLKEFVNRFIILYNSYEYGDFSNLTALGDYQTEQMQKSTLDLAEKLKNELKEGDKLSAETDINSFTYSYPKANELKVSIKGKIIKIELITDAQANVVKRKQEIPAEFEVQVYKGQQSWLVNDIK